CSKALAPGRMPDSYIPTLASLQYLYGLRTRPGGEGTADELLIRHPLACQLRALIRQRYGLGARRLDSDWLDLVREELQGQGVRRQDGNHPPLDKLLAI